MDGFSLLWYEQVSGLIMKGTIMSQDKIVTFDRKKVEALRQEYRSAVFEDRDTLIFEGNEFNTEYAKYVLEFLDVQLSDKNSR